MPQDHKEEKFYHISKDETLDLVLYTVLACMYLFLLLMTYRRVFVLRPAITKHLEARYGRHTE